MSDSCSARKLVPGLAAQYSIPSDLITSNMKSQPGRTLLVTSMAPEPVSFAAADCAFDDCGLAAKAAAPAAPAPARKLRRFTFLSFATVSALLLSRPLFSKTRTQPRLPAPSDP